MNTLAVVLEEPHRLALRRLDLKPAGPDDVVVEVEWSGISTGTERLLWSGRMPPFPGMGYPLVPGYEAVGRVVEAGRQGQARIGDRVFVPGSSNFIDARGLFGGSARTLITPGSRVVRLPDSLDDSGILLSLAATAQHAIAGDRFPDLIVGYGTLGRLLHRLVVAHGAPAPTVWETNPARQDGVAVHPDEDPRRDYSCNCDASGAADLLDTLVGRLARSGEIVLAGFYEERLSFAFPFAFMKEARFRIAAEFRPDDLTTVIALIESGALTLDGLITHRRDVSEAQEAYSTAFGDPACLKMILDWRNCT
jgi:3-hydroxyethyl bacteriochlorophyllide a dehydrogenase